jgi:hypothetical protein
MRLSQVYVTYQHIYFPSIHKVIYATNVLVNDFRSHPLTMCASQLPYSAK